MITFIDNQKKTYQISNTGKLKIIRIRLQSRKYGRIGRLFAELRYSRKIIKSISNYKDIKCDAIICYSPSIFYGRAINWLKREYNSKAYLIVRDIFPRWALDAGVIKEGSLYKYFKFVESVLYSSSDFIGIESKKDLDYFKNFELDVSTKVEVLNNWGATLSNKNKAPLNFLIDTSKVNIVYGGNMGSAQDLLSLVKLIDVSILKNRAVIYLIGSGNQFNDIKKVIIDKKLSNIVLMQTIERNNFLSLMTKSDIGLCSLNEKLVSNNYPLKMIGYMQLSKPVLAHINSGNEIIQMIRDNNIGLASIGSDGESFNKNLDSLITNKAMREELGQNAFNLFNNRFSVKTAASQILNYFK